MSREGLRKKKKKLSIVLLLIIAFEYDNFKQIFSRVIAHLNRTFMKKNKKTKKHVHISIYFILYIYVFLC